MRSASIRGLTVCVGYDDFLKLTLPRILLHVKEFLVITSSADIRTQELVASFSPDKVRTLVTDVFYERGASFNKGAAIEQGFDALGRDGWLMVMDADIVFPVSVPDAELQIGHMYSAPRYILPDVQCLESADQIDITPLTIRKECGNYGYFQLFNASDPVLKKRPWYEVDWTHAGGADASFRKRWNNDTRKQLSFQVVHLGDPDNNWHGRATPRIDTGEVDPQAVARLEKQAALHRKYGWCGQKKTGEAFTERLGIHDPTLCEPCHDVSNEVTPKKLKNQPVQSQSRFKKRRG